MEGHVFFLQLDDSWVDIFLLELGAFMGVLQPRVALLSYLLSKNRRVLSSLASLIECEYGHLNPYFCANLHSINRKS